MLRLLKVVFDGIPRLDVEQWNAYALKARLVEEVDLVTNAEVVWATNEDGVVDLELAAVLERPQLGDAHPDVPLGVLSGVLFRQIAYVHYVPEGEPCEHLDTSRDANNNAYQEGRLVEVGPKDYSAKSRF